MKEHTLREKPKKLNIVITTSHSKNLVLQESLGYEVTIVRIYANPFVFLKNSHIANNLEKMGIKVVLADSTMKENGPKSTTSPESLMLLDHGMSKDLKMAT